MARLWPTPAASLPQDGETPRTFLARRESLRAKGINGNGCGTPLAIEAQLWATPQAVDAGTPRAPRLKKDREHRPADTPGSYRADLKDQAATWSTPRASDGANGGPNMSFGAGGTPLPAQAAAWATPTARDGKDGYLVSTATPTNRLLGRQVLTMTRAGDDGSNESRALNPRFVEALMGWPPGWSEAHPRTPTASSDCASSATAWSRWWRRMRSELSALGSMPDDDLFAVRA